MSPLTTCNACDLGLTWLRPHCTRMQQCHFSSIYHIQVNVVDSQHATHILCHTEALIHLNRVHNISQPCTPSTLSRNERYGWRVRLL